MQYLEGTLEGKLVRGYSAYDIAKQHGFDGTELEWLASLKGIRVKPIGDTKIAAGTAIEVVGIPEYVENTELYPEFGLTDEGWYAFARIKAPTGEVVTENTAVIGAAGFIAEPGSDFVDVAVEFETAAMSVPVVVNWSETTETFIFKATDLAVRNMDYRTTFYVYDIAPYITWSYALTSDTEFAAGKNYYILAESGEYVLAEVTAGDAVPTGTYYNHSKLHFEGMARNVTYNLEEIVDCPIEIVLPEIPENGYGAWFDIQMRYDGTHSCTLLPPDGVKIGTAQTQSQTKGVNIFELQYTDAGDVKMWTLLNTHSNIPS